MVVQVVMLLPWVVLFDGLIPSHLVWRVPPPEGWKLQWGSGTPATGEDNGPLLEH